MHLGMLDAYNSMPRSPRLRGSLVATSGEAACVNECGIKMGNDVMDDVLGKIFVLWSVIAAGDSTALDMCCVCDGSTSRRYK